MVRYLLTFSNLNNIYKSIANDVRYLLDPRKYLPSFEPRDIAIVPNTTFSDIESQKKILILIKRNELCSDYGIRKFCSEITIAGYLYNCFKSNLQKDHEYYKKRDGFYDMFRILEEISFARNRGLGIFNELTKAENELHKNLSDLRAQNHGKYAAEPTINIKFKPKIASLLKFYENDVLTNLDEILKGNDLIKYCNNEYLFANNNIYQCYPRSNFNFTLKHINDFYKSSFDFPLKYLSTNLKLLKDNFRDADYLLYLSKWLNKDVKDLFTSVNNLLDSIYTLSEDLCRRYDSFDTMFYWFDYLMRCINQKIVDCFDNISCVLYYGDLKRELVNNNRVQEKFSKIYHKFSSNLLNDFYPKEKFRNENEVLQSYFFSEDTVLGKGQQDQKEDLHAIARILVEMNYDWMNEINSLKFIFSEKCSFYTSLKHYGVYSDRYGKGVLQILKYEKKHQYICDFIEQKRIVNKDINFFEKLFDKLFPETDAVNTHGDSYTVISKRMVLFYDSFFVYFMDSNDNIKLKIYYKIVFPSIDVAVLSLAFLVFKVNTII